MIERLAQAETHYPAYEEPDSGVTAVAVGIRRFSDGYWLDFNDSTFKASGWTTKHQALAEDDDGLWTYDTGWAIPDADAVYQLQWKVTDASGSFYRLGPKILVNSDVIGNKDGYYLAKMAIRMLFKEIFTEANGNLEQFTEAGASIGTITTAVTSDGTYTTRKKVIQ